MYKQIFQINTYTNRSNRIIRVIFVVVDMNLSDFSEFVVYEMGINVYVCKQHVATPKKKKTIPSYNINDDSLGYQCICSVHTMCVLAA